MGVDGKLVARIFPDCDGLGKGVFGGVLCVLPVFNGGSGESIIMQVSFLVLGEILGFGKSCHVCGEDSASRIAQDSGISHFVVDWCPTVGCIGWLRPDDVVSLIS
jgi:hypothetical protein